MKLNDDIKTDFRSVSGRITNLLKESGLVSDTTTGGVVQTLAETFAVEMSTFYSVLEKFHDAGYLETAKGAALDNVVAILGIKRAEAGLLTGKVVFSRSSPSASDIVIPERTKVTGPPLPEIGDIPVFETEELVRIPAGQLSAKVAVHEIRENQAEDNPDLSSGLPAGALTIMPRPILGVESIDNPSPILTGNREEDDGTLKIRAAAVLKETQKCTLDSLKAIVKSYGLQTVKILESADIPGRVEIHIGDPGLKENDERFKNVKKAVKNAKAAGIQVEFKYVKTILCMPAIEIELEKEFEDMDDNLFYALAEKIKKDTEDFINGLGPGVSIPKRKLEASLLSNTSVAKAIVSMKSFSLTEAESGIFNERKDPWTMDVLEKASVNQELRPISTLRKFPLKASLNMILSVPETELMPLEDIKLKARIAAAEFIETLMPEDGDNTSEIKFERDGFLKFLKDKKIAENLNVELLWIVRQGEEEVKDLKEGDVILLEETLSPGEIETEKKASNG